jgi:hypothetical protein
VKNKIHFWFVSFTTLVLITGCVQGKCGDGICQKREERRESCPQDCGTNITEAFCGNGTCESEEDEHNCPQDCQGQPAPGNLETIKQHGGRVSWSHARDLIAFDCTGLDGYTDIYLMNPDGADEECLTCNQDELPQLNIGNPEWHPSGDYIVFQAQNPALNPPSSMSKEIYRYVASPGAGINNDLWLMSSDGTQFWQLTEVEDLHGTLHPHFSLDGSQLMWSEMISPLSDRIGNWAM